MTVERKVRIEENQNVFIQNFADFGFQNVDEMIGRALELLREELAFYERLELSAELYAEVYATDLETQEWTEASTLDFE